jgi:hypothetical protein
MICVEIVCAMAGTIMNPQQRMMVFNALLNIVKLLTRRLHLNDIRIRLPAPNPQSVPTPQAFDL